MTKKELEQLNDLKAEIIELEQKIVELEKKKIDTAKDVVNTSCCEYPYIQGHATISGYESADGQLLGCPVHPAAGTYCIIVGFSYMNNRKERAIKKCIELLRKRKQDAQELEVKIMEFINGVDDSRVRRIMQYRYIEGYKMNRIAKIMHYDRTYPEKLINTYLEKCNKK